MGVDDEYRAVSTADEGVEHLLEKSQPITRAAYKKRSLFASVAVGALVGAAVMFAISLFISPTASKDMAMAPTATATATTTVTTTAVIQSAKETGNPLNNEVASSDSDSNSKNNNKHNTNKVNSNDEYDNDLITDCGETPQAAREKGCVFDVMMQLWMPPACYDEKLSERYLAGGNWTWWADADASRTLTLDEMRLGEHTVIFVVQDYHKQHCIFAWEKLVRALRNEHPVIEELISYDHVMHCKKRTLSRVDDNVRGVRAPTAYARCAKYDTWTAHLPGNTMSSVD